ncbi:MAG: hypothetical protein JWL81_2052, partial [Verrucomicrobiales bacterium]|nr:hypothetical protein [Verrucomicrobiales bacterium]
NTARTGNFNAIVAQVRKRGDAYYRNGLEPTASDVSAGFDPLADLLTKAHDTSGGKARLEVHAWLVTYNIWNSQSGTPSQATHPYTLHPDWLSEKYRALPTDPVVRWDNSNYLFDQGHPAVQQHTFNVAMDILTRYNIDGLHFDYIRYPDDASSNNNQPWGYHPVSVERYRRLKNQTGNPAPTNPLWLQWRRDQVTALLRKVYLNAWALKPQTRVSAALITYGTTAPGTAAGNFATQSEAYQRVLQDWDGWLKEGILDLACPMVYKTTTAGVTNWTDFIRRKQYNRAAAIGLGSYLNSTATNLAQMKLARTAAPTGEKAVGVLGYSYYATENTAVTSTERLNARNTFMSALTDDATAETFDPGGSPLFASPAALPAMPWKTNPALGHLMGLVRNGENQALLDGATLTLSGPASRTFISDATGWFGAVDLPVGTYTLTVSMPGLEPRVRTVTITGTQVLQESLALSPPVLEIRNFAYDPATRRASLTWSSVAGQTFTVEYSDSLDLWSPHISTHPSGGLTTSYQTPAVPPGTTRRSWRVRRNPL